MAELTDLTVPYQDYFRSSYNLGFHPAVLVGQTMNLDGQRASVQTQLDTLSYLSPQSVSNVNLAPNSVSDWNLNNISFNKARGGSLILGGINNQNGLLQVQDAAGNVIIQQDNTGQTFSDIAGHKLVAITPAGFENFNTSGGELTAIDNTGFHTFDGAGHEITKATNTGYILRNTRGMFFEETNAGNFGSIDMDNSNIMIFKAGQTTNAMTFETAAGASYGTWHFIQAGELHSFLDLSSFLFLLVRQNANEPADGGVPNGSMWYNSDTGQFRVMASGVKKSLQLV